MWVVLEVDHNKIFVASVEDNPVIKDQVDKSLKLFFSGPAMQPTVSSMDVC